MVQLLKRSSFFIGIGIALILFFIFTQYRDEDQPELTAISSHGPDDNHTDSPNTEEKVMVDIKGEVNKPGVYELDANARVEDAIQMADGFTKNADQTTVNLAQKVVDEMMVIVPKEGDVKAQEGSDV